MSGFYWLVFLIFGVLGLALVKPSVARELLQGLVFLIFGVLGLAMTRPWPGSD